LNTLFERGLLNGVDLEIFDQSKLSEFEPLATTHDKFLWSPTTAVSSPNEIISAMAQEFISLGGRIEFNQKISLALFGDEIHDATNAYDATHIINAAGAQADRISRSIGVGADYAMLPFMGVYSATEEMNLPLRRLVYPVPHPVNPFLGVHFTLTIDHKVKIGPTAIPIIGREQYSLLAGWSGSDIAQSLIGIKSLMLGDAHNFGAIIKTEWPKVFQKLLVRESLRLVPSASQVKNWSKKPPGIRAQLVHKPTGRLEQDFVVERKLNSTHVLNAVSPGWTSALPFGRYLSNIVEQYFD
jgi:L-2-hydroxyglutarate oxidase LhgO